MQTLILCAALALALSGTAVATPAPQVSSNINPVVVTATRSAEPVSESLAAVTVITRTEIRRLQPTSLHDLLDGLPGVSFSNSGGVGQQTSLFLRGTNSDHTLVLIDGVRVGSVSAGLAAFEQIPVDQIQRIEIVRGPRSSLYGSDAIGGVIQIFTRHGTPGQALQPSFSITGGSHSYGRGQAGLSGGTGHAWYNLSVGTEYIRGINSCKLGAGTVFAGCFANQPDADGYRSNNGLLNLGYRWDNGAKVTGNLLHNKSDVEFDGSFQNRSRHVQQVAGLALEVPILRAWTMRVGAGQNLDKATNYENNVYVGFLDSTRNHASWKNTITLAPRQQLVAGVDVENDRLSSGTAYTRDSRNDVGIFAQYQGSFGGNEIQLSARRDHNQQFGDHVTGGAAYGYHFGNGMTLRASWGSAFHAPTFNDLYYPSSPGYAPSADPHLKPEKSRSLELGLGDWQPRYSWQLSAYRTHIHDLIALDALYTPANVDTATIDGAEAQFKAHAGGWHLQTDLTWQRPINETHGANHGNDLARRIHASARVDLSKRWGRFSAGVSERGFSDRYDDLANTHRLGGYALTSIHAGFRVLPHWQVQARLANAFDRDYETVYYYNQPGRTAYLTLRYTPGGAD